MKHPTFVQSILAEWWATTLFLFFLILSVLPGGNDAGAEVFRIAIVAGLMIFALVYCFYAVSGGNINPAVSLGLVLSGRMTLPRGIGYIAAQIVGAITGVAMAKVVSPTAFDLAKGGINALQTMEVGADAVSIPITAPQAFFGEVFGTLLLVLAVLFCTDTARSMEHPHMTALIPLTIGLVVLIDHLALIPIDGKSCGRLRLLRVVGPPPVLCCQRKKKRSIPPSHLMSSTTPLSSPTNRLLGEPRALPRLRHRLRQLRQHVGLHHRPLRRRHLRGRRYVLLLSTARLPALAASLSLSLPGACASWR